MQEARDLFNTRGYRSVTVQDFAERLGISIKTIYQYFSSKEEIATAIVEESMGDIGHVQVTSMFILPGTDPIFVIKEIINNMQDEMTRLGPLLGGI